MLDEVEYWPISMTVGPTVTKKDQIYRGVQERASDGIMCLGITALGGERRHNIEVSDVVSIVIAGERHHLKVPRARWKLRAQEIVKIVEGQFSEGWAADYFDPQSPRFYLNEFDQPESSVGEQSAASSSPTTVPVTEQLVVRRGPRWRWLIILLVIGYVIGRYRLIRWALRAAGQHWGLWL
ncbi:hypothetical protein [Sphingomonas aquatica]|uniref:hypothetical protein n=1 Tax=Sphingomonas aquatica TaxID=1763824 RepID=UPI00301C1D50